jgi:hypothetical protein
MIKPAKAKKLVLFVSNTINNIIIGINIILKIVNIFGRVFH